MDCKHDYRYILYDKDGNKIPQTIVRDKKGNVIAEEESIVITCSKCDFVHLYQHEHSQAEDLT
jgi:predicted nucleic-acid-binding Zn-ribbon protein